MNGTVALIDQLTVPHAGGLAQAPILTAQWGEIFID
jgi:hypothetical protein